MTSKSRVVLLVLTVGGITALLIANASTYYFVDGEYGRLLREAPSTRAQVEESLRAYVIRRGELRESAWTTRRSLEPGQTIVRYSILGFQPIDVIYGPNDEVLEIVPSYE